MASASTSLSNCSKENSPGLGATSEWIVANSGHSRSQFMEIAVKLVRNTILTIRTLIGMVEKGKETRSQWIVRMVL